MSGASEEVGGWFCDREEDGPEEDDEEPEDVDGWKPFIMDGEEDSLLLTFPSSRVYSNVYSYIYRRPHAKL